MSMICSKNVGRGGSLDLAKHHEGYSDLVSTTPDVIHPTLVTVSEQFLSWPEQNGILLHVIMKLKSIWKMVGAGGKLLNGIVEYCGKQK